MLRSLLAAAATTVCLAAPATAAVIAYDVDSGTVGNQSYPSILGMDFEVNTDITILSLGAFDHKSDGLSMGTTLVTELWSRNGNAGVAILASASFMAGSNSGTLIGGSLFKDISALTLGVGEYSIVSYGYNIRDLNGNKGTSSPANTWSTNDGGGLISFVGGGRYAGVAGASIGLITDGGPDDRYAAGTFSYEAAVPAVPLPASLPLMLGAFGLFAAYGRRKSA